MNLGKNWQPVIENFHSKLSMRLTLIMAVLDNLPAHYISLLKAPLGVMENLEKIRHRFLWGGSDTKSKIYWVSWDKVTTPKE
uniref:Uncharacterized protein n=1 Tax=Lactuca sativa TaxID=4236 RepID=A0A9R1WGB7_LACSA|nr:hypothetical protein LSAT_V11C200062500 [Lactuca sativa]